MNSLQIRASIFKITDKISGFNLLPEVRQLVALETLDHDRREEYQLQKLRKLLIHAGITVPYYQNLFRTCNFHPEKLGSLVDLKKLPVLDKKQIRESPEDFLSTLYRPHDLAWGQTGGSTGRPMKYALDPVCRVKVRAPLYRALSWAGWKPGDVVVSLWGRPIVKTFQATIRDKLKSFVTNYHEIDAHVLGRAVLQQYIQVLLDKNPRIILGYASALNVLADYILENDICIDLPNLSAILSTAEMLLDPMKANIERAFHTQVLNSYGTSEIQGLADTCASGSMHIHSERVILDRDDGESFLLTDLDNYAMPMINYRVNDTGVMDIGSQCPCGRTLPILRKLRGRSNVNIRLPGKRIVHSEYFTHLFEQLDIFETYSITCYQIHQNEDYSLCIRFDGAERLSHSDRARIETHLHNDLDGSIRTTFGSLTIENSANKYQFITSDLV